MDGCIIGLGFLLFVVLYITLGLRVKDEQITPAERHVDARHEDPSVTHRRVMAVVDEVHGRWYEGKHADEVIHLHLPKRVEIARHDSDLRGNLRWLEREAGEVDVVLHYEGEPAVERRVVWDRAERSADGRIRRAEWRRKEAGCLPLLVVVVVLALLLAGCGSAPVSYVPPDPAALRATAQAAEALAGQVEQQAQATRAAQEAHIRQTAEAMSVEATRQAVSIEATRQALAAAEQSYQLTATAQAMAREAEREEQAQQREGVLHLLAMVILLMTLLALGGVVVLLVWKAGNEWIAWQSRRRQLVESRAGTLLLVAENVPPVRVQVIQPALPARLPVVEDEDTETEPIPYSVDGNLVGFIQRQADPNKRLVLRLLRESIQLVGARSSRIPGWRELNWSAEQWSQAVRLLWRYVETQPGRGTYLTGEYPTLQDLYFAVGERRAILSPAPTEVE